MLPARFEYHRASTVEEALALLDQYGEDAKILAGGQSLIPLLKLRFAAPEHLIDVNPIQTLRGIAEDGGTLKIGALTRHNELIRSEIVGRYPVIAAAAPRSPTPGSQPRHDRRLPGPRATPRAIWAP